ncbi:hypothetical protein BH24ACT22_BH24ACT22_07740 [soil metagenome]
MRIVGDQSRTIDLDEFLSRPLFAHLSTASPSGPRESPVWFLWENGCVWILGNQRENSFQHRIEQDPRCALGVVDFDRAHGTVQHVGFRGQASIERYDVDTARRLLTKYLGPEEYWDEQRFDAQEGPEAFFVRFVPETVVIRDQSYSPAAGS